MDISLTARRQFDQSGHRRRTLAGLRRRTAAAGLVAVIAIGAGSLVVAGPAAASAGVWGAGHYPYSAGLVCTEGTTTSPLATYDFGSGYSPAALTTAVSSTGTTDSAALPYATSGTRTATAVAPGMIGFTSLADIGIYAELLNLFGSQDAAEVAQIVLAKTGSTSPAGCVSAAGDAALIASATALAGPYTVALSSSAANNAVQAGTPFTTTATVTGGSGQPVAGATVTFASTSAQLAGSTAVTDSSGRALMKTTLSANSTVRSASVSASVSGSAGLRLLSATGAPTASNPSGHIASAIYPAAPTTATGNLSVSVADGVNLMIASSATPSALAIGATITPAESVTGLNGHAGVAAFTVYGPLALPAGRSCSTIALASWDSAPVAATSTATISGDKTTSGAPFAPTVSGCYAVRTSVASTNATPNATATSAYSTPITVVATTAHITVANAVVGTGPINAQVTIADSNAAAATITSTVLGPVLPAYNSHDGCASINWAAAPSAITVAKVATTGDGVYPITSSPTSGPGCYQVRGSASMTVAGLGSVAVPLTAPNGDGGSSAGPTLLVLAPTLTTALPVTSVVSPASVTTKVSVGGTFGQPAHVTVDLMYVPMDPLGCDHADFTHATLLDTRASTAVAGDGSYEMATGATPKLGCYAPVERLVLDSNQTVTASSVLAAPYTTFLAGVDLTAATKLAAFGVSTNPGNDNGQVIATLIVFAFLLLLCAVIVIVTSAGARRREVIPAGERLGSGR